MDACHVLLGRPLEYDRNVIHDGRKNTYTLNIKGQKVVLAPRKEGHSPTSASKSTNLLSMSRFLDAIKQESMIYALLPCGTIDTSECPAIPIAVQQLLHEFLELMPDDFPPRLPPCAIFSIGLISSQEHACLTDQPIALSSRKPKSCSVRW